MAKRYVDRYGTFFTEEQFQLLLSFDSDAKECVHVETDLVGYAELHWMDENDYIHYRQMDGGEWAYHHPWTVADDLEPC